MKKLLAVLLALVMVLSLAACGAAPAETPNTPAEPETPATEPAAEPETPWPYKICRWQTTGASVYVDFMFSQQSLRFENQVVQDVRSFLRTQALVLHPQTVKIAIIARMFITFFWPYQQAMPIFVDGIMRQRAFYMFVATFYHKQMPVLRTCMEM